MGDKFECSMCGKCCRNLGKVDITKLTKTEQEVIKKQNQI